jgi:hypothetical protein
MCESWEDVNGDRVGHRTCINQEPGTFCCLLYLGMVIVADRRIAARSCTHWALKSYVDQGTFQDGVVKMFWLSLLAIFSNFSCFLFCCTILILSCTHEHFSLVEGVIWETANIIFDKAAWKVIKDVVKYTCLISTALYYSHVLYHAL